MAVPTRDELRSDLAGFDATRKKVVGGVLAVMFQSPERVRDREWVVEQFTQVALVTGEFEQVEHAHEGVEVAREWIAENIDDTLNACYALFVRVAEDMAARETESHSPSDAMLQALTYFG